MLGLFVLSILLMVATIVALTGFDPSNGDYVEGMPLLAVLRRKPTVTNDDLFALWEKHKLNVE